MSKKISVLFVCLGNICRSTMAEGVFRSIVEKPPYKEIIGKVDSCGTGAYHVGDRPDSRTMATLRANGVTNYAHRARKLKMIKVHSSDFDKFDYIFAMDESNLHRLQHEQRSKPNSKAKVMLFGEYSGTGSVEFIDDPYYDDGNQGFERAFEQATRFSTNFLKDVFPDVDAAEQ